MKRETILAHAGSRADECTGALTLPIHQTATFRHPALGESTGYDYSRSGNPTRAALEQTMASLDGGAAGFAFGSGMAALDCLMRLFAPGDTLIVTEDLYGGTFRLLEELYRPLGIQAVYVDSADTEAVRAAFGENKETVKAVLVESPTNPLLKVADLAEISRIARDHGALTIVDNTFLTPCLQRPLALGADLTVYSASKYLSGHNDVVAGCVVAATEELAEKVYYHQNAVGGVLGPQDSWLVVRGLKTLQLRLERQQQNASAVAKFLTEHPNVERVFFPGLPGHRGHERMREQADGFGAMVSLEVTDPARVPGVLSKVEVFSFAESLGGVESLITFPAEQTHADIAPEIRDRLGINDRLLRLSLGVEHIDDLIEDLGRALA